MAEPVSASIRIAAPPERVFAFFTRPELVIQWMGEQAWLDPRPGGRFDLDIKGARVRGEYLAVDPPCRLVLSWGYEGSDALGPGASTVEVRLVPDGEGTRVELEHRDLPDDQLRPHRVGWDHYLGRLALAGRGTPPPPDPGMPDPGGAG